ncbi:MAG: hypothetical protein KGO49_11495 [Gammaproteobacteria bacterium]|nr:hypothetical protein [Gammaproteobacteria bacterium]
MRWLASHNPSFIEFYRTIDLPFDGWSNWLFTYQNFYAPLVSSANKIYLFGIFIRPDHDFSLYQLGGSENEYFSPFPELVYDGRRRNQTLNTFNELLPYIQSHFKIENNYLVAKDSFFEDVGSETSAKLLLGSSRDYFDAQLVFDLSVDHFESWKQPFINYLSSLGKPSAYFKKGVTSYDRLHNKFKHIVKTKNIAIYSRPCQKELYLLYPNALEGKIGELKQLISNNGSKEFRQKLDADFEHGYEALIEIAEGNAKNNQHV